MLNLYSFTSVLYNLFPIDTDTLMAEMIVAKNAFQTVYQGQVIQSK